ARRLSAPARAGKYLLPTGPRDDSCSLPPGSGRQFVPWVSQPFSQVWPQPSTIATACCPMQDSQPFDCCSTSKPMLDSLQSCVEATEKRCAVGGKQSFVWESPWQPPAAQRAVVNMARHGKQRIFRILIQRCSTTKKP